MNLSDIETVSLIKWIELADAELDQMKADLSRLLQMVEPQTRDNSSGVVKPSQRPVPRPAQWPQVIDDWTAPAHKCSLKRHHFHYRIARPTGTLVT